MVHYAIYVVLIHELSLLIDLAQEGLVIVVFVSILPRERKELFLSLTVEEDGAVFKAEELLEFCLEGAEHGFVGLLLGNDTQERYCVVPICHFVANVPLKYETFYAHG